MTCLAEMRYSHSFRSVSIIAAKIYHPFREIKIPSTQSEKERVRERERERNMRYRSQSLFPKDSATSTDPFASQSDNTIIVTVDS